MSTILERLQYGFDRDSRRTWRRRAVTTGEDNAYGYDGLSQVTQAALGNLNQNASAISAVPAEQEAWDYDPTGNWRGYQVEEDGSVSLDQQRVHDKGNRLTQISDDPSPVLLDRAGRMTQVSPDASGNWDESQQMTWDAWGRVTSVKRASDGTVLGSYAYDGLTRRTVRTVGDTATHSYYSDKWRPLEERTGSETTAATQYYWGARHRDDLVRRDRATTDGGDLDETRYVLMDYFSPAAITDETGAVTERYRFSAFGVRTILNPSWVPADTSECGFEFAFQGQFLDTESGFLDYGYRYLSPYIGRWLCKDPIVESGGANLYGIVGNDLLNSADRLGLCKVSAKGVRYQVAAALLDALEVGTPYQDMANYIAQRLAMEYAGFNMNIPAINGSGPITFKNAAYQAGGINFPANVLVTGHYVVYVDFEIDESDGPCILSVTKTLTGNQGARPINKQNGPSQPTLGDAWTKANRKSALNRCTQTIVYVDSPGSFAVTIAVGAQPPVGFRLNVDQTVTVIDEKTNAAVDSIEWKASISVNQNGFATFSP